MSEKESVGFDIKCKKCGATYKDGDIFIQAINGMYQDDSVLLIECYVCGNKQREEI